MKKTILISLIVLMHAMGSLAQEPGDFDEDDPDENPTDAPAAPISDGICFLAFAAVVLSGHSLLKTRAKAPN